MKKQNDAKDNKLQDILQKNNKSMVDLSTQILFLGRMMLMGLTIIISNTLELANMNAEKIDSSIYLMKIIGPYGPVHPILFLMITLGYYWRNDSLRDFLARKANAVFGRQ